MHRLITLLLALALAGCDLPTCAECVRRCAPFAVAICNPHFSSVSCACDARAPAQPPKGGC